jgi:transporter family protein
MDPILLAIISAVILGLNASIIRMGVNRKPFSLNSIITFFTAAVILWLFAFIVKSPLPSLEAWPYFIIAGILAPGFAAILTFESFKKTGVAFTTSLVAISPLFATGLALIILKEKINVPIALGTILIVFGIFFLSWFRPKRHVKLSDLWLAIAGAAFIGFATTITKFGLNISNLPYSAIAISTSAGAITLFIIISALKKWNTISKTFHDAKFFIISGFFFSIGIMIFFIALSVGDVTVLFPLNRTQPLFAMLFAWFLLKKQDHITRYTVAGAIAIVSGAFLISMGA